MILIGLAAWKGLENILNGFNRWSFIALTLIGVTLLIAAVGFVPKTNGLDIQITGKFFGVVIALGAIVWLIKTKFKQEDILNFLWETWRFVKQVFPLLILGVFAVGVIRKLIRPEWIEAVAGENTFLGNLIGVVFGIFMYFPTLVEVPVAKMFLSLGMHRGPLLAYLMADPELSLQSILILSAVIGRRKTLTYVGIVATFSTLAGLIYGWWIDGASTLLIVLSLTAALVVFSSAIWIVNRHKKKKI